MKLRGLVFTVAALAVMAVPAGALPAGPRLVLNGKEVANVQPEKAHLMEDRLYVSAELFASAIGATVSKDEATGAYWIKTGRDVPTYAELQELNPKLTQYQALSPYVPNMGIHMGMQGPHLTVGISNEGTVNTIELIIPAQQGWQPWFDQPENTPMELEGLGMVYTQHIYLTDPQGLMPKIAGVPVLLDGRYLSIPWEPKSHELNGSLYIPVRSAVELLGGEIAWDEATWTASAEVAPKGITWEWLKELNPALAKYQPLSEFVPNMGIHHGVQGPHITVLVDSAGNVNGFELIQPEAAGWFPSMDQPENTPTEIPGLGMTYTQHIYLVDPNTIK